MHHDELPVCDDSNMFILEAMKESGSVKSIKI